MIIARHRHEYSMIIALLIDPNVQLRLGHMYSCDVLVGNIGHRTLSVVRRDRNKFWVLTHTDLTSFGLVFMRF